MRAIVVMKVPPTMTEPATKINAGTLASRNSSPKITGMPIQAAAAVITAHIVDRARACLTACTVMRRSPCVRLAKAALPSAWTMGRATDPAVTATA